MGTKISNIKNTHDPAGYPLAESEDIISGTEISYNDIMGGTAKGRTIERMKGVTEFVYDLPVDAETVEAKSDAQERKDTPVFTGVLKYFPNAIKYVSQVSKAGNDQHHPDKPLHWDKSKSADETDALARHLIDHSVDPMDTDGILHLGKVAWRALAALERYLDCMEDCTGYCKK